MKFLVTGAAGFIGFHVSKRLLKEGYRVVGIDNLNDYYDVNLKQARLNLLTSDDHFTFYKLNLLDREGMAALFSTEKFDRAIHFAAQVGVRYSLENPYSYIDSNLIGYLNVLEGCRHSKVQHLLYASSSSVYGLNKKMPFSTDDPVDHPISLYAATKRANELMSHTYSHLYNLPTIGLRFFTVYGPWSRPDMALFKFTKAIIEGESIDIYNYGNMKRDFTYIDDISEVIIRLQDVISQTDPSLTIGSKSLSTRRSMLYHIYNVGSNTPVTLMDYIHVLEDTLGKVAKKNFISAHPGDVLETSAEISPLYNVINFRPHTPLKIGIKNFLDWYHNFYKLKKSSK